MHLRDYQNELANNAVDALHDHSRIVVACPTGAGKTVIAIHGILPRLSGKVAWVTHRRELMGQVKKHGKPVDVFMAQGQVSGEYDAIFIDEGHHVCAAQYRQILTDYPAAKVIALTATPYRLDGVGLGSCGFSKILHGPDTYELTEMGMLCPVKVYIPKSESTSAWRPEAAAQRILAAKFSRGIVFCRSVAEAKETVNNLQSHGVPSESIDGTSSAYSRAKLFTAFERGKIKVLCNHTIFTEGVDVPAVDLIVLNRHTLSRCLWKQMIGRGTRNFPGKTSCTVLDLAGNGVAHGSIYDREIYDLNGHVESTEPRQLTIAPNLSAQEYDHNNGEDLKEWKPKPKPVSIIESLQRLKSRSPLLRLKTGLCA
jgi:DNA repair protein RadD